MSVNMEKIERYVLYGSPDYETLKKAHSTVKGEYMLCVYGRFLLAALCFLLALTIFSLASFTPYLFRTLWLLPLTPIAAILLGKYRANKLTARDKKKTLAERINNPGPGWGMPLLVLGRTSDFVSVIASVALWMYGFIFAVSFCEFLYKLYLMRKYAGHFSDIRLGGDVVPSTKAREQILTRKQRRLEERNKRRNAK